MGHLPDVEASAASTGMLAKALEASAAQAAICRVAKPDATHPLQQTAWLPSARFKEGV